MMDRTWPRLTRRRGVAAGLGGLLAGCASPLPPEDFADAGGPELLPDRYFEGPTRSWGVIESSGGAPEKRFGTECFGRRDGPALIIDQTVRQSDGTTIQRTWRLRQVALHRYSATAAPVIGTAEGEAYGRFFHWKYDYALDPGDWLHRVEFEHWMYLHDDADTLLNRFTVRKLGLVVARASEVFRRG